jgi:transcriptional regulator
MRPNPLFGSDDPELVRELIRDHPWATLVSQDRDGGLVASHYPILLGEESEQLVVLTHVGRPDEELHDFGQREVLLIVQGTHGYISPSWYAAADRRVPTWNFTAAHCHGVPEILDPATNLAVLTRLQAHFEARVDAPAWLDQEMGARVAAGTVGLRIAITRFDYKRKLSQNKTDATRAQVIAALRAPGPYQQPQLADEMERVAAGPGA